jgi:hypothetical protein
VAWGLSQATNSTAEWGRRNKGLSQSGSAIIAREGSALSQGKQGESVMAGEDYSADRMADSTPPMDGG